MEVCEYFQTKAYYGRQKVTWKHKSFTQTETVDHDQFFNRVSM
jgi:hypothetical protein